MQATIQTNKWYSAFRLNERITSFPNGDQWHVVEREQANALLQTWMEQRPFKTTKLFQNRLASSDLTHEQLRYLLTEPEKVLVERVDVSDFPSKDIDHILNHGRFEFEATTRYINHPLVQFIRPILGLGLERVQTHAQQLDQFQSVFVENIIDDNLLTMLIQHLIPMVEKVVVLEMHLKRRNNDLLGDTPETRFNNFIASLCERENANTLLQKYPVLTRQLVHTMDDWALFCQQFLSHLYEDWNAIKTCFSVRQNDRVVNLQHGVSDRHNRGRVVLILQLESGTKIVYKPRGLQNAIHFQQIVAWCNAHGFQPALPTLNILDRSTHGWVEFIEKKGCDTVEEVQLFYQRIGGWLALLHTLNANDFHSENLIASGEYPYLIDFESLLVPSNSAIRHEHDKETTQDFADQMISESVLRVGLLSTHSLNPYGVDMSGVGDKSGQLSPHKAPHWQNAYTDEMRLAREHLPVKGSDNQPTIKKVGKINVLDYVEDVVAGFTNMYMLLKTYKTELLNDPTLLKQFDTDSIRVLLRNTQTYARILEESHHPSLLQDALRRDQFFDHLWAAVTIQPYLERVIPSEHEDLWNGDIPIFTTTPTSIDLYDSRGQRITNFFSETGRAQVERRIADMGAKDLAQQVWFIRASFTALGANVVGRPEKQHIQRTGHSIPVTPDSLLAHAKKIGDLLIDDAIIIDNKITWFGLDYVGEDQVALRPTGLSLYEGVPGIALFLAYLSVVTKDTKYSEYARLAIETLKPSLEDENAFSSIGAFDGWGGIVYMLVQLGSLWNEPDYLGMAERLLMPIERLLEHDTYFDIIAGSAGCIAVLLTLDEAKPSQKTLDLAIQCGQHLLDHAASMSTGIGWSTNNSPALAGYSHGASGIAWALFRLANVTGQQTYFDAALEALRYERTLYRAEQRNWLDLREGEERDPDLPTCMTAWCHGAPGIGLARIAMLPYHDTDLFYEEIKIATETTIQRGFGHNHSLCHGELGNLELIFKAAPFTVQAEQQYAQLLADVVHGIETSGYICGVPMGVGTPGLMTGLTGIGYQLLRLAHPDKVPSVLTLEGPIMPNVTA